MGSCSHETQGDDNGDLTSAMGLMQALISVFADDGDKIRSINAGRTRISFLLRSPLYYACVSSWREPESVVRPPLICINSLLRADVTSYITDSTTSGLLAPTNSKHYHRYSTPADIREEEQLRFTTFTRWYVPFVGHCTIH